jgi:hypothetical protein
MIVQKFDTETSTTTTLSAALPSSVTFASGLANKVDGTILIFNAKFGRNVLEFKEDSGTGRIVGQLPFQSDERALIFSNTGFSNGKGGVWLFSGNDPKTTNPVLFFDTKRKSVKIPTGNSTSKLPTLFENPATVTDGKNGYIIGGIGRAKERDGSYHPGNGILRYWT